MSSASRRYELVISSRFGPTLPSMSGALTLRIATRSMPSLRAALSISGSIAAAVWFSPGPRCGPRGGVLVSTEMPRQRIAIGW